MNRFRLAFLTALVLPWAPLAAQGPDAAGILAATRRLYEGMEAYSSEVTLSCRSGAKSVASGDLSLRLARPSYRLSWTTTLGPNPKGALFRDGEGVHLLLGNAYYTKVANEPAADPVGFSAALGITMGGSVSVPSLFYSHPQLRSAFPFERMAGLRYLGSEEVGEEECHLLEGEMPLSSDTMRLWISKRRGLVLQIERTASLRVPGSTDGLVYLERHHDIRVNPGFPPGELTVEIPPGAEVHGPLVEEIASRMQALARPAPEPATVVRAVRIRSAERSDAVRRRIAGRLLERRSVQAVAFAGESVTAAVRVSLTAAAARPEGSSPLSARVLHASPEIFRFAGFKLELGRLLTTADGAAARPVVVVGRELAASLEREGGLRSVLGARLYLPDGEPREIVGVVAEPSPEGRSMEPRVYLPLDPRNDRGQLVVLVQLDRSAKDLDAGDLTEIVCDTGLDWTCESAYFAWGASPPGVVGGVIVHSKPAPASEKAPAPPKGSAG